MNNLSGHRCSSVNVFDGFAYRFTITMLVAMLTICLSTTGVSAATLEDDSLTRRKPRHDDPCHTLGVTRTYLDVNQSHASWDLNRWRVLFDGLSDLGFNEVIVRSTSGPEFSIYEPDEATDADLSSPLEGLAMAARETGIRIWVGLHESAVDVTLADLSEDEVSEHFLDRLEYQRSLLLPLTLALLSIDPNGSVFRGWFVTDVVDARFWIESSHRKTLNSYLRQTRDMLERVQPSWPVMISGHAQGSGALSAISKGWTSLLDGTRIDVFLFQDGIGYRNLTVVELDSWLEVLSDELQNDSRSLGVVVEPFDAGATLIASNTAEPAPFARVIKQLESARLHGREPVTMFSLSEYLSDDATAGMRRFYRRWWLDQRACRGTPRRFAMR